MFNSISSCGTLRFAPWKLTSFGFVFSVLAFWTFISFHFGLLGFHFLSFWPFCPLFPVIFGLLGLHSLSFWPFGPCGPSFPCILALWASFPCILAFSGSASGVPPHKLPKMARLPNVLTMDLSAPGPAPFCSF